MYVVREKQIEEMSKWGEISEKKVALIMEVVKLPCGSKAEVPHPINQVIYNKYYNKSINSAINEASTICEFLNYIHKLALESENELFIELKHQGIFGLNFHHAASFLNYSIGEKGNLYDTVKQKERRILNFYKSLIELNLLDKETSSYLREIKNKNVTFKKTIVSPFDEINYQVRWPSKDNYKTPKLVNLEEHLYQLLIEISEKHTPSITFGVVLQIMGGLRKGEVVNLRLKDLKLERNHNAINAKVKDRHELFEGRDLDLTKNCVKKTRQQVVFNFDGSLIDHYKNHINIRCAQLESKNKICEALLIDNNGQPMSGEAYEYQFEKLKSKFLSLIENNDYPTYLGLKDAKWSTHICRGIFTNVCIDKGYAKNIRDLANLRGDRSDESSKVYWDAKKLHQNVSEILNRLNEIEDLDEIT